VHLDNEGSEVLRTVEEVHLARDTGRTEAFGLRAATAAGPGRWRITLGGIESRDDASRLTGRAVLVAREALDLGEGELLVSDLSGRQVVAGGETVGAVRSVYSNGAQDVLVVETERGLVDVPLVEQHVTGPDGQGRLIVDGFASFAELAYAPARGRKP
jgi:ribosomal 30S subunit maturation factor RimM